MDSVLPLRYNVLRNTKYTYYMPRTKHTVVGLFEKTFNIIRTDNTIGHHQQCIQNYIAPGHIKNTFFFKIPRFLLINQIGILLNVIIKRKKKRKESFSQINGSGFHLEHSIALKNIFLPHVQRENKNNCMLQFSVSKKCCSGLFALFSGSQTMGG